MIPPRVRDVLAAPKLAVWLAFLTAFLLIPTTWTGLLIDDFFHRLAVQGAFGIKIGPSDLFCFLSRAPHARAYFQELGFGAWWMPKDAQVSYFRPLASFTHVFDYALFPNAAWLMHVENLAWYGALVVAAGGFYKRFLPTPWVSGLALAFYALDHAHATPVAWIANRNAMMASLFGVIALRAHVAWREDGRARTLPYVGPALLAAASFALALLSAESGLAIAGYLAAYALCLDRAPRRARLVSLAPYGVILLAWRVGYRALGYGVIGSGISSDPLIDPLGFALRALQTWPLLLASDVVAIPADALAALPAATAPAAVVSWVLLLALAYVLWPLVRRSPTVRFLACGCLLSTVPFGATLPTDRYVFWSGLGLMGLLAELCAMVTLRGDVAERASLRARLAFVLCVVCVFMRGVASPLFFPFRAAGPAVLNDGYLRMAKTLPAAPGQTVVVLNSPLDLITIFLPIVRMNEGEKVAEHQYLLHGGEAPMEVTRVARDALELSVPDGWMPNAVDRTLRAAPFRVGEVVTLARMRAEVREVLPGGRASRVRFTFPVDLEDASLAFVAAGPSGYAAFPLPAVGGGVSLGKAPLLLNAK